MLLPLVAPQLQALASAALDRSLYLYTFLVPREALVACTKGGQGNQGSGGSEKTGLGDLSLQDFFVASSAQSPSSFSLLPLPLRGTSLLTKEASKDGEEERGERKKKAEGKTSFMNFGLF